MKFPIKILLVLLPLLTSSQELPPFLNFEPNLYGAGNQNWMVTQGENGNLYFANGMGLLEFTGEAWNLYPVPNHTIVRSVAAVGNQIFTGAYMEFGYWTPTERGTLEYTSLLPRLSAPIHDGEQFWHTVAVPGFVIFQSFEGIYLYNLEKEELGKVALNPGDFISGLFEVDGQVFFQVAEKGLFSLQNGEARAVISPDVIGEHVVVNLFRREKKLHLITEKGNFLKWENNMLQPYHLELSERLKGTSIFSALALDNGELVLGTVAQGMFHLSDRGEVTHFDQEQGLLNNTILALFQDRTGVLWAGLDNGLGAVKLHSRMQLFEDRNGEIGSVYCSFQDENYLYIGTNQGLYFRKNGSQKFELIPETNGQVWSLQKIDQILFCGHNSGTFLVEGTGVRKISTRSGTWVVKKFRDDTYIQGHYNGLSFLRKEGEAYKELPLVADFPHSSRYVVKGPGETLWIGNEHKGVFQLQLSQGLDSVREVENFKFPEYSGITSSIFRFNDTLYYATKEEVLQFHPEKKEFTAENSLARSLEGLSRISGKILGLGEGEIWGFEENAIFKVDNAQLRNGYRVHNIYLPKELKAIPQGNENISRLREGGYFMGIANGYLVFEEPGETPEEVSVRIDRVLNWTVDREPRLVSLDRRDAFSNRSSNFSFSFSTQAHHMFPQPLYSYRLLGQRETWSEWSGSATAVFENLKYGDYEFQVKALVGNIQTEVQRLSFEVKRPWFLSWVAIAFYIGAFLLLLYLINIRNHRRHEKLNEERERALQLKHLEAEQEIIKLQNQQLEQRVTSKNKELAVSMMNLIQKNEILSRIRKDLKNTEPANVKDVIRTIDKEISEEDTWNFFREAFTNADKDFFKKIKALHPELTSNDLRLCAYLRLNLSSKEIAPLLNISVKSVEIKRYRLRKKMNLSKKKQLVDHILEV